MSVTVLLEANVKPESMEDMKKFMADNLGDTRAFDGCHGISVHTSVDDPNTMVLVEEWESKDHYEKYLGWRTETGGMDTIGSMLAGEPNIRYFNNVDA